MDKKLYLCSIKPDYLKYLHKTDYKVSVKYNNRPFVGLITTVQGRLYVLPLTSQTTQLRKAAGKSRRSSKITTFVKDSTGTEIANILHNNMLPVKQGVFTILNIDANTDTYEANEIRFIRKNRQAIIDKARKVNADYLKKNDPFLSKVCCDFAALEKACDNYTNK